MPIRVYELDTSYHFGLEGVSNRNFRYSLLGKIVKYLHHHQLYVFFFRFHNLHASSSNKQKHWVTDYAALFVKY